MIVGDELIGPKPGDKYWTRIIDEDRKTELYLVDDGKSVFIKCYNGQRVNVLALSIEAAEALGLLLMKLDQELHPDAWTHWIDPLLKPGEKT